MFEFVRFDSNMHLLRYVYLLKLRYLNRCQGIEQKMNHSPLVREEILSSLFPPQFPATNLRVPIA